MEKIKGIEAIIFDWIGTLSQFGGKGLFPYSEEVLRKLRPKYSLAVISKAFPGDIGERQYQINEIRQYFEFTLVDAEKDPEDFIYCMEKLKVLPANTLVVDDRMDRGIKIGNDLGCVTAWIQQGKHKNILPSKETGKPDYKINSVEDLLSIL